MFISTEKYEELQAELKKSKEMIEELNKENQRLAEQISVNNTGCKIGPWCDDCGHLRTDSASVSVWKEGFLSYYRVITEEGKVRYCAKHLHDLCPEHTKNSKNTEE